MGSLLFSPKGRIDSSEFSKGALILIVINFVLWMSWTLGLGAGVLSGVVSLILIYMWGCLFAKRFHDSNKSGWLYLLIFIVYIVLFLVLTNMLVTLISPEANELLVKIQGMSQHMDRRDQEAAMQLMAMYGPLMKMMALPYALASTIAGAILAFGINALLKHDPEDNQFGPA